MSVIQDIGDFLKTLSFIDIVFFFSITILMILIVTLIYFIRINEDDKEEKEETAEMKIVKEIRENMKSDDEVVIKFTDFEKDQEDKAIISYDELLNKNNNYGLNYEKEDIYDDLSVKKVNLDNFMNNNSESKVNSEIRVISFAKEEAFLEALKRLQKELG